MPREPLGEEEVMRGPVDVGNGGVAERVERVEPVEVSLLLPCPECKLDPALRDASARLGAEEWGVGGE